MLGLSRLRIGLLSSSASSIGGGGSFSPLTLFASGEQGAWYDPSDLSTMFQDTAGTTPVTATGQTVGLLLDKSGRGNHATQATAASRPIYGIEPFGGRRNLLVRTEEFDNAAWVKTSQGSATAPTITANAGTAPDGTTTAERAQFARTGTTTTDRSRLEQTSIPIATATNYTFSVWMKSFDGTDQTVAFFPNFGAGGGGYVTVTSAWQRFTVTVNSSSSTTAAIVLGLGYFTGSVTAADILIWGAQLELGSTATAYQRVTDQWNVTQAGVPSVSYIQCDGTDDFLLTGTITPGTDGVSVFAGIRKISDAARGAVVELTASTASNNGAFLLAAPNAASATIAFESKGTTLTDAIASSGVAAPITAVVTAASRISTDANIIRVNGVQADSDTGDQGSGNFSAAPLYIGRRGGTSLPLNGRIYALLVRFAQSNAGQIASTETWVAGKTGVTL